MVAMSRDRIVNISNFERDVSPVFVRGNHRVSIATPCNSTNSTVNTNDLTSLIKEITRLAEKLPHSRCALTYKINENSSIALEIHPVTDAA